MGPRNLIQGDPRFVDRAETIAYNALPAALTADMWGHNYLTTINEIQAARTPHHMYGDTPNATIYGTCSFDLDFPACGKTRNNTKAYGSHT